MPEPVEIAAPEPKELSTIERSLLEAEVVEQIRTVYDPEIPVNVYDLGLIYDIQVSESRHAHIVMTLTSPMCPVAGSLPGEVQLAAEQAPSIKSVDVELTWDPPFTIDMIPEETRLMLGFE
jgi:FeS assembly SUF system protein